ncbi:MAG: response regulator transcription factor [Caldilineaceae bacterium SB0670_bin_27]|uniref:Response regulator transcription factor n=1 Tax=Caldilineaceae bacterium SB0664_bin_27 TaxID=2605260 RepID=A0A6B0YV62_9CHLR|nr:response regulator transcription factor [Caldilineaceae bacterium]MXY94015.1 response regulator transcription factor [Caldilineaceae bacterium SB0664_bin_27]MYJ79200.1 response regulator transcription factor [Caldilineaceae bacterium SB0670_bin_27]
MTEKISLMLVDDQPLFRDGMALIIEAIDELFVVGEAGNGQEAIDLYAELRPDVVLMDVHMPGVNGIDATRRICAGDRQAKIIILTTFEKDQYIFEGLRAGARGYLLKATNRHKLADAVRTVHQGEVWMDSTTATKIVNEFVSLPSPDSSRNASEFLKDPLNERELEVLHMMADGLRNREIARHLHLAEGTVKNYVSSILSKLFVQDRTHAVARAKELGLI